MAIISFNGSNVEVQSGFPGADYHSLLDVKLQKSELIHDNIGKGATNKQPIEKYN